MTCTHPVLINDGTLRVPCGRCVMCKVARSREWATRILHEASTWPANIFVTLTFDDAWLPPDKSLHKQDVVLFFKRLRQRLSPRRIKYYACGEYGGRFGRPHYHAIIFGLSISDKPLLVKAWPYGFVDVGLVTYESARYCAEYMQTQYSKEKALTIYGTRQQPFNLLSKGLGKQFLLLNAPQLRRDLQFTVRGIPTGLPRYYKTLLELTEEEKKRIAAESSLTIRERMEKKYGDNFEAIYNAIRKEREQKYLNFVAKLKTKKERRF